MVRRIQIPDGEEPTLSFIARLSDGDFSILENSLREQVPTLYISRFVKGVLRSTGFGQDQHWKDSVSTILSIAKAMDVFDAAPVVVASDLASEMEERGELDSLGRSVLQDRLERVLSLSNVELATQVDKLLASRGNVFSSAVINTQLQPLFTELATGPSFSAVVFSHELQIEVFESGDETRTLRTVMDDADLYTLRKQIDRAIARRRVVEMNVAATPIKLMRDDAFQEGGDGNEE